MTKSQERRAAHKAAFKKIGEAITAQTLNQQAWRDRAGDHHFRILSAPIDDKEVSSRIYGPQMKSQQWERTSK